MAEETATQETVEPAERAEETLEETLEQSEVPAVVRRALKDANKEAETLRLKMHQVEERAKANAGAVKELERLRAQTMTETERAVAEAEQRGRTQAMTELGSELVRAEFRAQAAGKIPRIDEVLEDLNLSRFLGEDLRADSAAVAAAVERLSDRLEPVYDTSPGPRPDLSQASGGKALPLGGDPLLRDLKNKLGIP